MPSIVPCKKREKKNVLIERHKPKHRALVATFPNDCFSPGLLNCSKLVFPLWNLGSSKCRDWSTSSKSALLNEFLLVCNSLTKLSKNGEMQFGIKEEDRVQMLIFEANVIFYVFLRYTQGNGFSGNWKKFSVLTEKSVFSSMTKKNLSHVWKKWASVTTEKYFSVTTKKILSHYWKSVFRLWLNFIFSDDWILISVLLKGFLLTSPLMNGVCGATA